MTPPIVGIYMHISDVSYSSRGAYYILDPPPSPHSTT
jgi:hypothetical protein